MRRILKIFAGLLLLVLVALWLLPGLYEQRVGERVRSTAAAVLGGELRFDQVDLGLLRSFPHLTLILRRATLVGGETFAGDTIATAERLSAMIGAGVLFGRPIEVRALRIVEPELRLWKRTDGAANWKALLRHGTKPSYSAIGMRPAISLDLRVDDAAVRYANDSTGTRFAASVPKLRLRQASDGPKLSVEAERIQLTAGGIPLLYDAEGSWESRWQPGPRPNCWRLGKNDLRLNAIRSSLEGWVDLGERDALLLDLRADCSRIRFKELLSMIPPLYARDFRALVASGDLNLSARARGRLSDGCAPAFELKVGVHDGRFQYTSLPEAFRDIHLEARIAHTGGTGDALAVEIPRFELALADNSLRLSFAASGLRSDPFIRLTVAGRLDLSDLERAYPLYRNERREGLLMANVRLAGRRSDLERERLGSIDAAGTLVVEKLDLRRSGFPPLHIRRAAAALRPEALTLGELNGTVGSSDLALSGKLTDYLGYLFGEATLGGALYMESERLDLNELVATDGTPAQRSAALRRLDLTLRTACRTLRLRRSEFGGVRCDLHAEQGTLAWDGTANAAFGGHLAAVGKCTVAANGAEARLVLDIDSASPRRLFAQSQAVRHFAPLFGAAEGNCALHLVLRSRIGMDLVSDPVELDARGTLAIREVRATAPAVLERLADTMRLPSLRRIEGADVQLRFSASGGTLRLDPLELRTGGSLLRLIGCTAADGTLDYDGLLGDAGHGDDTTAVRRFRVSGRVAAPHVVPVPVESFDFTDPTDTAGPADTDRPCGTDSLRSKRAEESPEPELKLRNV